MMQTITITPKWQIHIPVEFRHILGMNKPGLAEMSVIDKTLVIKPKTSPLLKLSGKYHKVKPTIRLDVEKIRDQIDYSSL